MDVLFRTNIKKLGSNVSVPLRGNNIDFVYETKYIGVIIHTSMKTSFDIDRQTRRFYVQNIDVTVQNPLLQ